VELLLVVGAPNSSNSNRLQELGIRAGVESHLITRAGDIADSWLAGKTRIGVTAGASAPEILVSEVIERLKSGASGDAILKETSGIIETVAFAIPKALRKMDSSGRPLDNQP
ncbi:MAG: 4-hydroxy-3-methylbut-2-enyl diphosphate reductase, partial [Gammaproteobacteria bacterium]|nr:4-hydroxy-3-methylbut-2-enyl diphosphate reductase [Gammaproteobacteria bacterium]